MLLNVGKIINTHGLNGELKIIPTTDYIEQRFTEGSELYIMRGNQQIAQVTVESARQHQQFILVKFDQYDDINDVEKFKGLKLKVDDSHIIEEEENAYYFHQIIGCQVLTTDNKNLGEIIDILTPGANDVWVVKGQKEYYIPYIEDVVKTIDIDNKKIIIEEIEGLLS